MNSRAKSLIATIVIHAVLGYALVLVLAVTVQRGEPTRTTLVDVAPDRVPPAVPPPVPPPVSVPPIGPIVPPIDWAAAGTAQRDKAFVDNFRWARENLVTDEERRLERWRATLPQGSGPARVTRLRPADLPTHTLYWPAQWSKGPLPIVAWANGYRGQCINSSLPYAAFLAELASHGYFIVAVGNDDIDYPQPEGLAILADGRPVHTQPDALTKAVDWAVAENARAGGPYAGRLDPSRIVYMGHGCGGRQAVQAGADPRAAAVVALSAPASLSPAQGKAPLALFDASGDDPAIREAAAALFAAAGSSGRPAHRATLPGPGRDTPYAAPDRRWTAAILAWLDQLR